MKHGLKIIQALPSYLPDYYYITGRRLKTTTVQKYRTSRSYNILLARFSNFLALYCSTLPRISRNILRSNSPLEQARRHTTILLRQTKRTIPVTQNDPRGRKRQWIQKICTWNTKRAKYMDMYINRDKKRNPLSMETHNKCIFLISFLQNDTKKFIESISEALTTLGVFNELNNTFDISQHIKFTLFNIDLEILQGFLAVSSSSPTHDAVRSFSRFFLVFQNFPSKDKIREAELMKSYTRVSIKQLDENFKIVRENVYIHLSN